jgi:hypothetical protein
MLIRLKAASEKGTNFAAAWKPIGDAFPTLRMFAAGLSTVFPGSSSAESDFSIIGQDKSTYRSKLSDLSIEGMFHACQRHEVEALLSHCRRD